MVSRWRVSGAILGLDVALADFSLVSLSNKPPPRKPTVGDTDRRTFIETVALVVPRSFTDADRDTIVAAMAKGRERLESARTTADVAALADAAAISAARRALLSWMVVNDPDASAYLPVARASSCGPVSKGREWTACTPGGRRPLRAWPVCACR